MSYVHKIVSDDSQIVRSLGSGCPTCGQYVSGRGATLDGVEIHKFMPFATIKRRAQIGVEVAGGVGKFKGALTQTIVYTPGPGNVQTITASFDASRLIAPGGHDLSVMPLGRAEIVGTAIIAPAAKLRFAGGLDLPGYNRFSIGLVYLIGAR